MQIKDGTGKGRKREKRKKGRKDVRHWVCLQLSKKGSLDRFI